MKYSLKKTNKKILLYCKNNIVTNINDEFTKLSGFTKEEIIGKSLTEVGCMIRIDSQVCLLDIDSEYNCYMFTKEYEPREVTIVCKINQSKNEKIYHIKEKSNSRIEDKVMYFHQLCTDNQVGASVYSSPDLILLKDNQTHLDFLVYPYNKKENSIGKSLKETLTGYVDSNIEKRFIKIIETGSSYYAKEVKYDRPKGGVTYWDISIVPIYIQGKIKYLVQTLTDVTEKVVNRMLAEEKTKQLEAIIQNISDEVIICDKDESEGNLAAGVMLGRDIGDRLKNEENKLMKAQYEILSRTIDNLELNYAIISYPDAKIKYINRNAFNYLRKINPRIKSIDFCIGKSSDEIFKLTMNEKAALDIKLKELIVNKKSHFILTRKTFIMGKESFEKVICQPLYNLKNEVTELVTIQIDITEEIEAKNKIEEALKLQDELFTNVAHELKTPLNVIYSTIQLMEMYFKNASLETNREKTPIIINVIKQNCYRFMRLINNIVDISKVESGFLKLSLSNENIVQVVENIVQLVSEHIKGKGINIIFDTDTEEKIIACDTFKIERIILNLISNSVKFSNSNNNIYVYVSDKNDAVEISIRDNGIGIDKKYLNRIFDRFYQVDKSLSRNAEGYGIGLSLVKSFVEMHGGKVSVDSEVGKGSIFKIVLPSRTIVEDELAIDKIKPISNKIEMINIEFSDIYSI